MSAAGDETYQCRHDGNQQEMNACAVRDFRLADAELSKRYRALTSVLAPPQREALKVQQRQWLTRRDPTCKAAAKDAEGGSIWSLNFYGCLEASTKRRMKVLESWPHG